MIVAVSGGKGGVGKSTVSLNLGQALDAVVVDADLATADLPRGRGPDLHDVLAGRASPMEAIEQVGSVELLPCGRTLEGARASRLTELPETVAMIDRQWPHVVIDCPAGLARDVGVQLQSADVATLVTTPKKPALVSAYKTRELAAELETPIASTVLNKSAESDAPLADRLEREIGAPTTQVADRDDIAEAQEWGVPVHDLSSDSPAVGQFEQIAADIRTVAGRSDGHVDTPGTGDR